MFEVKPARSYRPHFFLPASMRFYVLLEREDLFQNFLRTRCTIDGYKKKHTNEKISGQKSA